MPVVNEIAAQLATLGLGTVGTTIHLGMMPETPDVCCAVYEYGGPASDLGFGVSGVQHETPGVQVVFRGTAGDYATPRTSAATAHNGLAAVQGTTLSGTKYLTIRPVQSPFLLKRDANDRVYIACNYLANKEPS
jgi:hypothetical protein